ncbi:20045_t:CDS:2 [Funneliformis geosporum]|nr:20045_t:CDS:2 [Funneliformis geosporum]
METSKATEAIPRMSNNLALTTHNLTKSRKNKYYMRDLIATMNIENFNRYKIQILEAF